MAMNVVTVKPSRVRHEAYEHLVKYKETLPNMKKEDGTYLHDRHFQYNNISPCGWMIEDFIGKINTESKLPPVFVCKFYKGNTIETDQINGKSIVMYFSFASTDEFDSNANYVYDKRDPRNVSFTNTYDVRNIPKNEIDPSIIAFAKENGDGTVSVIRLRDLDDTDFNHYINETDRVNITKYGLYDPDLTDTYPSYLGWCRDF